MKKIKYGMLVVLMLFLFAVPAAVKADNNTMDTARTVAANQWISDTLGTGSARYYAVQIPRKGTVQVEFKRSVGSAVNKNWVVVLYGYEPARSKYVSLASDTMNCTLADSHFLPRIGVENGTFYLKVEKSFSTDKSLQYQFRFNVDAAEDWETEFNDGFETADLLQVSSGKDTVVQGNSRWCSGKNTDKDYYTFNVPKDGCLKMRLKVKQNLSHFAKWAGYLYGADGKLWMEVTCNNKDELEKESSLVGLPAGQYYAAACSLWTNPSTEDYQLELFYVDGTGWETERNETYNEADPAEAGKIYSGSIMHSSDKDFYRLTVPGTGNYRLDFRYARNLESKKTWIAQLEDQNGKKVTSWTYKENTAPKVSSIFSLSKGTYYFWVKGGDSWSGKDYLWCIDRYIAPAPIRKISNEKKGLRVSWSASPDAKKYILQRRTDISGWKDVAVTEERSWLDTTASVYGKHYRYRVTAEADGCRSNPSGVRKYWRLASPSFRSKTPGKGQVTVTWNSLSKISGYQIQIARNSKFTASPKTLKVSGASVKKYVIRNLDRHKTYYIRIRAYKESTACVSAWSEPVHFITK